MYNVDQKYCIDLGKSGESLVQSLEIDVSAWREQWPNAAFAVKFLRNADTEAYPVSISYSSAESVVVVPITATETAIPGAGQIQVMAYSGSTIVKSVIWGFYVAPSIDSPEAPEAGETWVDEVIQAGANAELYAGRAEEAISMAQAVVDSIPADYSHLADGIRRITGNGVLGDWQTGYYALGGSVTKIDITDPHSTGSGAQFVCMAHPCGVGDRFTITATGTAAARPWAFLGADDGTGNRPILSRYPLSDSYTAENLLTPAAPEDAEYVIFNSFANQPHNAISEALLAAGVVRHDQTQTLTAEQQETARLNIGAADADAIDAALSDLADDMDLVIDTGSGKNLFYFADPTDTTVNGLTIKYNSDGSITINGTATANTYIYCMGGGANLPAGTYTFSRWRTSGHGNLRLRNGTTNILRSPALYVTNTVTLDADGSIGLLAGNNTSFKNATFFFQIETGAEPTDYEPYAGGYANDRLAREQLAVLKASGEQLVRFRYNPGERQQNGDGAIDIQVGGNVRYTLVHSVSESGNYDCWRILAAARCKPNMAYDQLMLTTSGEWECALKMDGWNDFSGGYKHGNEHGDPERGTDIEIWCDGSRFAADGSAVANIAGISACRELRIYETTTIYSNLDPSLAVADHGREYVFTPDGLTLHQSIKWLVSGTTDKCYMAMFPIAKAVSETYRVNAGFTTNAFPDPAEVGLHTNTIPGATDCTVSGMSGYLLAKFGVSAYPTGLTGGDEFFYSDNWREGEGAMAYNKLYYTVCYGATVTAGDLWKSTTYYDIKVRA